MYIHWKTSSFSRMKNCQSSSTFKATLIGVFFVKGIIWGGGSVFHKEHGEPALFCEEVLADKHIKPISILIRFPTVWLFYFTGIEICSLRNTFWVNCRNKEENARYVETADRNPSVLRLRPVRNKTAPVYKWESGLYWRGQV